MGFYHRVILITVVLIAFVCVCLAKKKNKKSNKALVLREKETNAVDFIRLVVMRLIYGVATRVGLGENIADALNGAFVPPGVDDYDYADFGLDDRDDDFDY